jgi:two-component system cell cycle response regulator DivK
VGSRILVVEDDPQNLYLTRYLLEQAGHEVDVAHDGEEAIEKARELAPDLILMDLLLPRLDGLESTRRILHSPGLEDVTVVALSAYSMTGDRDRAVQAGCRGHIAKPIDPGEFVGQVQGFLDGPDPGEPDGR